LTDERRSASSGAGDVLATGSPVTGRAGLTPAERFSIFVRSFLLQSAWNTRDMQNVGFCFAMLPISRRFGGDKERTRDYLKRHLALFNTNPAMSTYALAAAAEAETRGKPGEAIEIKRGLSGPLGMAGDALLWGAARPLAGLLGVIAVLAGKNWAPILLLVTYNVFHLFLRSRGAGVGGERGAGARMASASGFRSVTTALRAVLSFAAGVAAALALRSEGFSAEALAVAGAFFVLTVIALRARVPVTAIGLAGVAGSFALMYTRF